MGNSLLKYMNAFSLIIVFHSELFSSRCTYMKCISMHCCLWYSIKIYYVFEHLAYLSLSLSLMNAIDTHLQSQWYLSLKTICKYWITVTWTRICRLSDRQRKTEGKKKQGTKESEQPAPICQSRPPCLPLSMTCVEY